MRLVLIVLVLVGSLVGQNFLPTVNTVSVNGTTCTLTVIDSQVSVATECVASNGSVLSRSVHVPRVKGSILGTDDIACLLSTDGTIVKLQCSNNSVVVLDGILTPVPTHKQWWLVW